MVSSAIKLISISTVGVGGLRTALWVSGIFSGPYESKWYGTVEGLDGTDLVCGKIGNNKYDCKLSLSLRTINSGGGTDEKTIKVTSITDILKNKKEGNSSGTISTLYLFDKDTSNLWYIFKGQGPWIELKISTSTNQGSELRPVVKTCRATESCANSCCNSSKQRGHVGQKVDENFERRWNDLISDWQQSSSPKLKKVSYKNIVWKLSYL